MAAFEKLFRAPYGVPNALERVDDGLWISDQISDRLALVDIAEPGNNATGPGHGDYGVTIAVNFYFQPCTLDAPGVASHRITIKS